jgi:hypothetical protein
MFKFINKRELKLLVLTAIISLNSCTREDSITNQNGRNIAPPSIEIVQDIISSGYKHTLILNQNNALLGWGSSDNGELGEVASIVKPKVISNDKWKYISSGYNSSLAIKEDGTLWAAGYNNIGQLGTGNTEDSHQFIQVGTEKNWKKVNIGYRHALAIKEDGTIWAWGSNQYFQLGDNTDVPSSKPKQVGTENDWVDIAAGHNQCFAIKKDGTLWAWGYNYAGQLGVGHNNNVSQPVKVNGSLKWKTVVTGISFTGGITEDGSLWMWGRNYHGELGIGTGNLTSNNNVNIPTKVQSDKPWIKLTLGNGHALGIKSDNTLWAWGKNMKGELGIGGEIGYRIYKNIPVQVNDEKDWINVSAGEFFSIAQKRDNSFWGWGSNNQGQLSTSNQNEPKPVMLFK